MEKEILEQIAATLKSISSQLSSPVDIDSVEKKLDKIIQLHEKQIGISEQILEKLGEIHQDFPKDEISLGTIEEKFERLLAKAEASNEHLDKIARYTSNLT